jgi:hypothetical protein
VGQAVQWGIYPKPASVGTAYNVKVYVNGVKVDEKKNQTYAPHGSINRTNILGHSGQLVLVSGNVY